MARCHVSAVARAALRYNVLTSIRMRVFPFAASFDPLFRLNEMSKQEKASYYNQVQFETMTHGVEYCDIFVSVAECSSTVHEPLREWKQR